MKGDDLKTDSRKKRSEMKEEYLKPSEQNPQAAKMKDQQVAKN